MFAREQDQPGEDGGGGGGDDDDGSRLPQQEKGEDGEKRARRARRLPLLLPFGKLRRMYIKKKRKWTAPPVVPLPYSEDMGKGCCPCFTRPAAAPASPRPMKVVSGEAEAEATQKPLSYSDFLKEMIEGNDFYSAECNVHRNKHSS